MNILFVSHCDFTGNSAMHVFSVAAALKELGVDSVITVPNDPTTVHSYREPLFPILHHNEVIRWGARFPNGQGPDLIHAWTPRELVRIVTEKLVDRYRCPYLVHLEDNERIVLADEIGEFNYHRLSSFSPEFVDQLIPSHRTHPQRSQPFLAGAAGLTVLIDRLLEFKPPSIPGLVFWPGFEQAFLNPPCNCHALRSQLNLAPDDFVLVYNGKIHHSNEWEVSSLILAVWILHRKGIKIKLVKTGMDHAAKDLLQEAHNAGFLIDLGFVDRELVPSLLSLADVLVQPGRANEFNDYRFPSKLPEFLASGKPVILPRSNLGRFLEDGVNCLLLENGDAVETASRIEQLIFDPQLRARLGAAGRLFANEHLLWSKSVKKLFDFYSSISPREVVQTVTAKPIGHTVLPVKLIAFYLPQYHPIEENDRWWGEGFTEWSNVASATPSFSGHHQPQLPANLGFYDLRIPEVMEKQVELATRYGISGFCLYYYWFNGRKLLDLPLNRMIASGKPDFPFCLCWANENWTRAWDGAEKEVLVEQVYSDDADERFIRELIPIFHDPRYIRVADAPLLLVYRAIALPDPQATAERWRRICAEEGIPRIHLAAVQSFGFQDPRPIGFDSAAEFPPHVTRYLVPREMIRDLSPDFEGHLEDYTHVARHQVGLPPVDYVRYRGVMPDWDNTPRRGKKAHVMVRSTPEVYEKWLRAIVEETVLDSTKEPLIFVNAWNEWAEGAHLEPDRKNGVAYLEATRRGLLQGIENSFNILGLPVSQESLLSLMQAKAEPESNLACTCKSSSGKNMKKTESWFSDEALESIYQRYSQQYQVSSLGYATVRDYADSFDHLNPLATANGDLKDVQRPWMLKAILGSIPRGGRLLEIGAGEPFVADLLSRLGYEVWVVDPYDGSGNGPLEFQQFSEQCPAVRFIRAQFSDQLLQLPANSLDCVYSISVLEHIPPEGLVSVAAGMRKFLKPDGLSIHAVDHVHRGSGAAEHLRNLNLMVDLFGLSGDLLADELSSVDKDPETYFLSAESHNRWRGSLTYEQFPMRVCVSVQFLSDASQCKLVARAHA